MQNKKQWSLTDFKQQLWGEKGKFLIYNTPAAQLCSWKQLENKHVALNGNTKDQIVSDAVQMTGE